MKKDYQLISGDSHVNEPPDLWTKRLPTKYKDRAPHMRRFEQGDAWVLEGADDPVNFGLNQCASDPPEKTVAWIKWEDCRPGGYIPEARIAEMDEDGVDAEILYPTPRVGNSLWWNSSDHEFHLECIRAYNNWLSEEYASINPERLLGLSMVPSIGANFGVEELERALKLPGICGLVLGQYPSGGSEISLDDDPFWAFAEQAGLPVNIHVAFATGPAIDRTRSGAPQGEFRNTAAPVLASQFIYSGVFDRFPDLQVVFAETDCGWVPYAKEQLDVVISRGLKTKEYKAVDLPSRYFGTNLSWVFINDPIGIKVRHEVGVEHILWSSDHAHSFSQWPHSWKFIDKLMEGVATDEKHAMLAGNAKRLYGLG